MFEGCEAGRQEDIALHAMKIKACLNPKADQAQLNQRPRINHLAFGGRMDKKLRQGRTRNVTRRIWLPVSELPLSSVHLPQKLHSLPSMRASLKSAIRSRVGHGRPSLRAQLSADRTTGRAAAQFL